MKGLGNWSFNSFPLNRSFAVIIAVWIGLRKIKGTCDLDGQISIREEFHLH